MHKQLIQAYILLYKSFAANIGEQVLCKTNLKNQVAQEAIGYVHIRLLQLSPS